MADSSAEYIQHHLTNLTYGRNPDGSWGFAESGEQAAEMGFYAIHVDSMFWSIFLGLVFCTVFRSVAKSATSGVPGMLQCCIEAIVDFIDDLTISIFQHKNPLIAPLALTIFVWVFLRLCVFVCGDKNIKRYSLACRFSQLKDFYRTSSKA